MTLLDSPQISLTDIVEHSQGGPVLVLKHSNTCGTSERVRETMEKYVEEHPDTDVFVIVVQDRRELSDKIEQHFGIMHETPQAIVLYKGDPLYYDDHSSISIDRIDAVIREADLLV